MFETLDITLIVIIRCVRLIVRSLMHLVRSLMQLVRGSVVFFQNISKASLNQMIIALLKALDLSGVSSSGIERGSDDVLHFEN